MIQHEKNMRRISNLDEIKSIELDILIYIHEVCEKNGLRYYMAGGTLLGAIRHKGFIPWDDDIDILMYREDYEKLIKIVKKDNVHPYNVLCCNKGSSKDYFYPYARITDGRTKIIMRDMLEVKNQGLFVDIFPIDKLPANRKRAEKYTAFMADIFDIWASSRRKQKILMDNDKMNRFILRSLAKVINIFAKMDFKKSDRYVGCVVNGFGKREIMPQKVFKNRILMEFEGRNFYAPEGYKYYLRSLYKDYMKLPPKMQRVHHPVKAWYCK